MAVVGAVVAASTLIGVSPSSAAIAPGSDVITTAVGGGGNPAITSGMASSSASLGSPLDAAFDAQGNVVFADQNNNVIRVAAASTGTFYGRPMVAGHLYTIVGNGVAGDIGDGSSKPLTTAELSGPNGVAVDAQGDIAITDSGNDAVRLVAATGGFRYGQEMTAGEIFTIAGGGQEGQITPGGSVFSAGFTVPDGVVFDAQGDVIVADTGNDILRDSLVRHSHNFVHHTGGIFQSVGGVFPRRSRPTHRAETQHRKYEQYFLHVQPPDFLPRRRNSGFAPHIQSGTIFLEVLVCEVDSHVTKAGFEGLSNNAHLRSTVEGFCPVLQFCASFSVNQCGSDIVTFDRWSILLRPQKATRLQKWQPSKRLRRAAIRVLRGPRRNMKTSTKDQIKGSFHEVKGTIKEQVGKATNDRNLKAEGKAEKKAGKVQQRIGHAKEAVANLKEQLSDLKKTG